MNKKITKLQALWLNRLPWTRGFKASPLTEKMQKEHAAKEKKS